MRGRSCATPLVRRRKAIRRAVFAPVGRRNLLVATTPFRSRDYANPIQCLRVKLCQGSEIPSTRAQTPARPAPPNGGAGQASTSVRQPLGRHLAQRSEVLGEHANAFGELLGRHGVLVETPAIGLLVELDRLRRLPRRFGVEFSGQRPL